MQELKSRKGNSSGRSALPPSYPLFDHAFNPYTILNSELREVLAVPRKFPRQLREEIAEILIYELFSEKEYEIKDEKLFMGKFGVFFPIFLNLRELDGWEELKTLARTNSMAGVFILKTLLSELFSVLDDYRSMDFQFSKRFSKNLEKTLKTLKKLIDETQAVWEKKTLEQTKKKFWWQEKPDTSLENQRLYEENLNYQNYQDKPNTQNLQASQESSPDALEKIQESIQKNQEQEFNSREESLKPQDQPFETKQKSRAEELFQNQMEQFKKQSEETEKTAGSEQLASMTMEFMSSEKAAEVLDSSIGDQMAAKIEQLIPVLEDNLEMLEILSMLFPGKMWDQSLRALHREYFRNLEKYASIFRKSSDLHQILEQIGRIELEHGSKKLNLSPYSRSEVHSVTLSGDIQTLLPVEAVKLKNPLLRRKFFADMLEGKLLTYQLRGENWNSDTSGKKRKGPVVALVDTSASMRGVPEILAKSIILAITKKMLRDGRDVKVILFSSKWETFEIELTNKKRMGQEFLEFLKYTFGGGTDFNTALHAGVKAMKKEKAFEGADLLFLTDGVSEINERPLIREWNEIKSERKARIFSLIIGNYDAGGLEKVSDHTYIIRNAENWDVGESPARFVKAISRPERF